MGSGEKGEKAAYKGLTGAQLAGFLREFADKLEEGFEESTDAPEEGCEKAADAAEEISGKTAEETVSHEGAEETKEEIEETGGDSEETSCESPVMPDFDPEYFEKLEMGIKKEKQGFSLKMKIKISHESASEKEDSSESGKKGKNRYKKTKKQMKNSFKEIGESLENGVLPDAEVVASFLQDSRLMTSFSEYGAEFFPEYDKACTEFRKAFESKDTQACKNAYSELNRLKKECHKRYKE